MSYTLENVNDCTFKLIFKFDSVNLKEDIQKALTEKQKSASLKGFRKGKAPMSVINQFYGPQAENEAIYNFISRQFIEAVQKEGLNPVGYPKFNNTKYESDKKSVEFEAVVEVFPKINVKDYSDYSFNRESDEVTKEDIQKSIDQYLASKVVLKEVKDDNRTVQNGDHVILNFEGIRADGSRPDNMKANDFTLEIGSGQFIPGFEDSLIGLKKSEEKTLELKFPENYHDESLKNENVKFETKILEIKEKISPDLTDELAKEFGYDSVDDMNNKITEQLKNSKSRSADEKLHQEILEKLVADNPYDIPAALLAEQRKAVEDEVTENLKRSGFNDAMIKDYCKKWDRDLTEKAEFQVRSGLILDSLAKKLEIKVEDTDVEEKITLMAGQSGMEIDKVKDIYLKNNQLKSNLTYAIREEKTFDAIKKKMTVTSQS